MRVSGLRTILCHIVYILCSLVGRYRCFEKNQLPPGYKYEEVKIEYAGSSEIIL